MKTRTICILVITTLLTVTHSLYAQGTAFSYQGHVFDNGTNFTGAGLFKFALVTSTNTATRVTAGNLAGTLPASQLSGTLGNGQLANSSITVNAGTGLSGGGTVALGGAVTLNATSSGGLVSVTGNADITATTVSGAVTLGTLPRASTPSAPWSSATAAETSVPAPSARPVSRATARG